VALKLQGGPGGGGGVGWGFWGGGGWGSTPSAIDVCLRVADAFDVQVAIHNRHLERGRIRLRTRIAAFARPHIHTFHNEGAGAGTRTATSSASLAANVHAVVDESPRPLQPSNTIQNI